MATDRPERKLSTILAADAGALTRLLHADEEAALRTLADHRARIDALVASHGGRVFLAAVDSVLAEFASPVEAVRCAIACQQEIARRNAGLDEDHALHFHIGINTGDVMISGDDLIGDGIKVAVRLEGLAEPGGICISRAVHDLVSQKLGLNAEPMGRLQVKNIAEPVETFRVVVDGDPAGRFAGDAGGQPCP